MTRDIRIAPETIHTGPRWLLRPALLALAVAGAIAFAFGGGLDYLSLQGLAEHRDTLRRWAGEHAALAHLAYAAVYASTIALFLPVAAVLTLTGGFLFGWAVGGILAVISATLGATAVFLVARSSLGEALSRRAGPWLHRVQAGFKEDAFSYLLFLRLVPAIPFWLVNLAPALLGMRLRDFVLATFIGIIPGTFVFSVIGSGLGGVLAARQQAFLDCQARADAAAAACRFDLSPGAFVTAETLIALALLGVIAILPAVAKRLWKRRSDRA